MLQVEDLQVHYQAYGNYVKAVDGVSFTIGKGEIVALVGESGSGKTTTALTIPRLLPPTAKIMGGKIYYKQRNLLELSKNELNTIRGKEIGFVFQEPLSYLNPLIKVGHQIAETLIIHEGIDKREANRMALELLRKVKIADPERVFNSYPHQLSGGMAQRVNIAIAIACNPSLLIADEPTSNLDVTIQAQILNLILNLKEELKMSVLLITHDLGVVSGVADKVVVMYEGKIVEEADVQSFFRNTLHPYSKLLLQSLEQSIQEKIPLSSRFSPNIKGCKFISRCSYAMEKCRDGVIEVEPEKGHRVLCWLYGS